MSKVYGYCRISSAKQNIERQERNIRAAFPDAIIIKETYTGAKIEGRKQFEALIKAVMPSDTIVFDSVSRMIRNAADGIELYEQLYNKGVRLVFLKEHHIDTDTYKNALAAADAVPLTGTKEDIIFKAINEYLRALRKEQILFAFEQAQKELDDLHQRTSEGIETARRSGKHIGGTKGANTRTAKKEAPSKDKIRKYSKAFNGSLNDADVIKLVGISRNTYYKYKGEMLKETEGRT